MKKIVSLITAISLLMPGLSFGHVGGPFSGDNFLVNNTGTYQILMFFRNGIGQARFSDQQDSIFSLPSLTDQAVFYFRGVTYFGRSFGAVDFARKKVTCIVQADSNGAGIRLANDDDDVSIVSNAIDEERITSVGYQGRPALLNAFARMSFTNEIQIIEFEGTGRGQVFIPQLDLDQIATLIALDPGTGGGLGDGLAIDQLLQDEIVPIRYDEFEFGLHAFGSQISFVGKQPNILGNVLTGN
ncbi:MAG: hypothetical protein AAGA58_03055 [Verrucomicrobiota bacterium]